MICLFALFSISVVAQTNPANSTATIPDCAKDTCQAVQKANDAAGSASDAAEKAKRAADRADAKVTEVGGVQQRADDAATKASRAADNADAKATEVNDAAQKANEAADAARKAAKNANSGTVLQRLSQRKGISSNRPLADYVPCLFDGLEDFDLRARENPFKPDRKPDGPLTEAEAEQVVTNALDYLDAAAHGDSQTWSAQVSKSFPRDIVINKIAGMKPSLAARELKKNLMDVLPSVPPSPPAPAHPRGGKGSKTPPSEEAVETASNNKTANAAVANAIDPFLGSTQFKRPLDVSCSFSILGWQETSDVFGRRVANNYVAIQVNIRNLSKESEFLIHDVQIAVDTGMSMAQFGRFQSGRDKLLVRSVAQRGQSEDRRNLILNTLQMVGNIASGVSSVYSQEGNNVNAADKLSLAVAMFQTPFITGLINIFPDHTIEHINHISDLVFSASSTNKTVVPVQGSVPLVTFLTEKPLEQMPFSRCGTSINPIFHRHRLDPRYNKQDDDHPNTVAKDPGSVKYPFCGLNQQLTGDLTEADPDAYTRPLHYKKWHPAALQALERNIYVVIAGVHIQELTNDPAVNNVKCPVAGPEFVVDLSSPDSNGNIPCTLNGKNLDRAASANLVSGANKVAAIVQAASDGNSATLGIPAASFKGIKASYNLMLRDTTGKDIDTKQTIEFGVRAPKFKVVADVIQDPTKPFIVILRGTNLDRINDVTLIDSSDRPVVTNPGKQDTTNLPDQLTVQFAAADVKTLATGGKSPVHVQYTTKDDADKAPPTMDSTNITLKTVPAPGGGK